MVHPSVLNRIIPQPGLCHRSSPRFALIPKKPALWVWVKSCCEAQSDDQLCYPPAPSLSLSVILTSILIITAPTPRCFPPFSHPFSLLQVYFCSLLWAAPPSMELYRFITGLKMKRTQQPHVFNPESEALTMATVLETPCPEPSFVFGSQIVATTLVCEPVCFSPSLRS